MVKEAIVLADGKMGSSANGQSQLPHRLIAINEKPFLSYVIDHLRMQGIQRIVFLLGQDWGVIENVLQNKYSTLDYVSVINEEPVISCDTIALAMEKCTETNVLLAKADVLFKLNLEQIAALHEQKQAECTLALKPAGGYKKRSTFEVDDQNCVIKFTNGEDGKAPLLDTGYCLINKRKFQERALAAQASFENTYLQEVISEGQCFASVQEAYFADARNKEDIEKAQQELRLSPLNLQQVDKTWTLFLDRDGVINEETVGEYVKHWDEFIFSKGVLEMFRKLSERFGRLIVVSNQRGVGKGLMTEADLQSIHFEMQREVALVGGRIDRIVYCTNKDDKCFFRKPNPGMAVQALKEFPDINLSKSIMVGNKPGDMRFGRSAGMFTVFVKTTNPDQAFPHPDIDLVFPSLYDFASAV